MRTKKTISAVIALCLTATSMLGTAALQASAADQKILTFDLRSEGKNEVKISADQIAEGDVTIPVDVFIPENPGVNGISLKFQVNDGQVGTDGKFGNYGFSLNDGALAAPFCFGSADKDKAASLAQAFNNQNMNLCWLYSADLKKNASAAVQADTTAWDRSASWAYANAFATANLVVPKGTPAGTYQFDIRKEKYVNLLSAAAGKEMSEQSSCISADSKSAMDFQSIPLTVTVESVTTEWEDNYKIDNAGHYFIIGDVCGKPGETVSVPVYVFGDTGTAGLQLYFDFDKDLLLEEYEASDDKEAYFIDPETKTESRPTTYTFATAVNKKADDGDILTYMNITIPSSAKNGDIYDIKFYQDAKNPLKVVDRDGNGLPVTYYNGSITVLTNNETTLNRTAVSLTDVGQTANLTLFNASGDVSWSSSDSAVATVDQNGFVKAAGTGTAVITATNGSKQYTATVKIGGLFGDVDQNGSISSADAQLILTHYVECMAGNPSPLTAAQIAIGEVSGDGETDITDAQFILNYYVEKIIGSNSNTNWRGITKNPNAPADY